jgi:hypothetical protein
MTAVDVGAPFWAAETCPACQAALTVTDTGPAASWECGSCGWTVTLPAAGSGENQ